ncbi:hypothetical protein VOLCADRAFT_96155 [Volvox carteri f. nagariensis]|uniref:Uncharacterized protein n=1 Tax=Volvox carteri f. nagariensis TaxID=3068 RepID=D8U9C7_VOLCA|nr:uncharacterized protein VOLCADRAFT_96155 [Volvox carteri f. nagariensis]EFJ43616.1 hypothetical protein VOLCADRAFT_96155 [Volvox carteri f. nagariensis]|eukprot:XP_002955316.1 hypothetical protein VOLCADRAFT_96155 [Volvox carteri f. nagariensis]
MPGQQSGARAEEAAGGVVDFQAEEGGEGEEGAGAGGGAAQQQQQQELALMLDRFGDSDDDGDEGKKHTAEGGMKERHKDAAAEGGRKSGAGVGGRAVPDEGEPGGSDRRGHVTPRAGERMAGRGSGGGGARGVAAAAARVISEGSGRTEVQPQPPQLQPQSQHKKPQQQGEVAAVPPGALPQQQQQPLSASPVDDDDADQGVTRAKRPRKLFGSVVVGKGAVRGIAASKSAVRRVSGADVALVPRKPPSKSGGGDGGEDREATDPLARFGGGSDDDGDGEEVFRDVDDSEEVEGLLEADGEEITRAMKQGRGRKGSGGVRAEGRLGGSATTATATATGSSEDSGRRAAVGPDHRPAVVSFLNDGSGTVSDGNGGDGDSQAVVVRFWPPPLFAPRASVTSSIPG